MPESGPPPTIAVRSLIAVRRGSRPSIVLVHGAATSAAIWRFWQPALAELGWSSFALDLRGHGESGVADLATTSMDDYSADVAAVMDRIDGPVVVAGWSMRGLTALSVAATGRATACVVIAPSVPVRVRTDPGELRTGTFGPEEYGLGPGAPANHEQWFDLDDEERAAAIAAQGPESRYARDQRNAGVVVESLPCPLLIATGERDTSWGAERFTNLWLPADRVDVPGATHYGVMLSRPALRTLVPAVAAWLESNALPA